MVQNQPGLVMQLVASRVRQNRVAAQPKITKLDGHCQDADALTLLIFRRTAPNRDGKCDHQGSRVRALEDRRDVDDVVG